MPCVTSSDAANLVNLVNQFKNHPAQFQYPPGSGKAFVTTFAGESCTFGASSPEAGWLNSFKSKLTGQISFVPSFFVDPSTFGTAWGPVIDGQLNVRLYNRPHSERGI